MKDHIPFIIVTTVALITMGSSAPLYSDYNSDGITICKEQ